MISINVLEVIRQGQVGGGESHLLDLIAGFQEDIRPVVLAFTGGQMIDTLRSRGVTCYVIPSSHPFDVRVIEKVRKIVVKEKIEIIHAHGSRAASNVAYTAHKLNLPLIYTVHGWSFHQDQSFVIKKLRAFIEKIICKRSETVICVSESNRVTGEKEFGLRNAVVIENGINLDRFNPNKEFKNLRQEFGFSKDDFIIGFISRITLQKAPLDFVKSIAIANEKEPRIKAIIVGEGDMKAEMDEAIKKLKIEHCVYTAPFRSDVPDLHNAIDVFCLPSLWEGLSIALLEAMAMRKALVVTPTDGTKEIIVDEQNGMIADFSNPEQLAECYLSYFDHPELVEKYGTAAMKTIEERFDSRRVSEEVTKIYKHTLNKTR